MALFSYPFPLQPYWFLHHHHSHPHTMANVVRVVQNDKDKYSVSIDVSHFAPNELTVTTHGHHLVIEGKHEEKQDEHGHVERHFTRKFELPKDVQTMAFTAQLTSDGVLVVSAPKHPHEDKERRHIPVQPVPYKSDEHDTQKKEEAK